MRQLAALYDIHGNLPALDAALAAIESARVSTILVGGDVALGWKFHHISNAWTAPYNPGLDGNVVYLGVQRRRGRRSAARAPSVPRPRGERGALPPIAIAHEADGAA